MWNILLPAFPESLLWIRRTKDRFFCGLLLGGRRESVDARPSLSLAASRGSCMSLTQNRLEWWLFSGPPLPLCAPWLLPTIALTQLLSRRALSPPTATPTGHPSALRLLGLSAELASDSWTNLTSALHCFLTYVFLHLLFLRQMCGLFLVSPWLISLTPEDVSSSDLLSQGIPHPQTSTASGRPSLPHSAGTVVKQLRAYFPKWAPPVWLP